MAIPTVGGAKRQILKERQIVDQNYLIMPYYTIQKYFKKIILCPGRQIITARLM